MKFVCLKDFKDKKISINKLNFLQNENACDN